MSHDQPLECAACRRRIRLRSRYYVARCSNETVHRSHFHRKCIKHDSRCGRCQCEIATLAKPNGIDASLFIKRLRGKHRNRQLAQSIFGDLVGGRAPEPLPDWVRAPQRASLRRYVESLNFSGDRWSGDARYRIEPDRLRSVLDELFTVQH